MAERPRVAIWALRILAGVLVVGCLSYLVDFGVLRWKYTTGREAFHKLSVRRYYAVPHKDGKEEYLEDDPRVETCVDSLFPHSAVPPCWYLNGHREQRIDM